VLGFALLKRQVLQLPEPPVRPTALWATKRQASPRVRSSESLSERLRQRSQPPHPAGSPSLREAAPTGDASGTPRANTVAWLSGNPTKSADSPQRTASATQTKPASAG